MKLVPAVHVQRERARETTDVNYARPGDKWAEGLVVGAAVPQGRGDFIEPEWYEDIIGYFLGVEIWEADMLVGHKSIPIVPRNEELSFTNKMCDRCLSD